MGAHGSFGRGKEGLKILTIYISTKFRNQTCLNFSISGTSQQSMPLSDLFARSGVKRRASNSSHPRKKAKFNLDDLPWKSVARPDTTGLDGDDGVLELEEVDGVEVIYEDTEAGRTVKFNVMIEFPIFGLSSECVNF